MKLSVIYTGGTIAMRKGRDGVLRPPEDPIDFKKAVPEIYNEYDVSFSIAMNKDSTDMTPNDWSIITDSIVTALNKDKRPDGIVVIHGVDTICFTASAVAYALGPNLNCPIVFTGAQVPAGRSYGDGMINLARSAKVARDSGINEVMILFNTRAFRACRSQKDDDTDFNAIESPAFPPLVYVKDPMETNPRKKRVQFSGELLCRNNFSSGILPIPLSPGNTLEMQLAALANKTCKGAILFSFGGHTVPDKEMNTYLPFIEKAMELKKPVLLASHYPTTTTGHDLYDSGKAAADLGAIPVSGYVLPALISKFSWTLAHISHVNDFKKQQSIIKTIMTSPYVGEITNDVSNDKFSDKIIDDTLRNIHC